MGNNKLETLLRNLEREAQSALAEDVSFLEELQSLKREVDNDPRVKTAMQALQNRGLVVSSSFVPRIRLALHVGEDVFALPKNSPASHPSDGEDFGYARQIVDEAVTQELRDAATAVVGSSPHCRQIDRIVSEALHASPSFERIAAGLERAGYELHICLDLSAYARVYERRSEGELSGEHRPPRKERQRNRSRSNSLSSKDRWQLPLSRQDVEFLRQLRITP